ncbi:hypothetical protein LPJ53_005165 [Coemansia erecta]|uniref:Uncharacterized protein n=1 Tax=Coemansia erecta TaxID=147472 RepID=A0A9W8CNG0_9FUNG|nr:hypothetical protein LPJ53_005165 [Coemansia erecta]
MRLGAFLQFLLVLCLYPAAHPTQNKVAPSGTEIAKRAAVDVTVATPAFIISIPFAISSGPSTVSGSISIYFQATRSVKALGGPGQQYIARISTLTYLFIFEYQAESSVPGFSVAHMTKDTLYLNRVEADVRAITTVVAVYALAAVARSNDIDSRMYPRDLPHEVRLSRADDNSNMPQFIDIGSLVAAAEAQVHADNSHQRDVESVEAPRPTANIEDVFANGVAPNKKPAQAGQSGQQPKHTDPKAPAQAPNANVPVDSPPSLKNGIVGKITVPASNMKGPMAAAPPGQKSSAASGSKIPNDKPHQTAAEEDIDVSRKNDVTTHTTRTVIANKFKTTTVVDNSADADDNVDTSRDDATPNTADSGHKKKKDDKVIALTSLKSGGMDRFVENESSAASLRLLSGSSSGYCSAALAAFFVIASVF